jgi:hypothetical protein
MMEMPLVRSSRPRIHRSPGRWLTAGLLLGAVLGCGGDGRVHPVQGHVRAADGRRATFGVVELTADSGGHVAAGVVQEDGTFRLSTFRDGDGAVAGRHRVIVVQVVNTEHVPLEQHGHVLDVHPRYRRYETSGLEFVVEPGGKNYLELVVDEAPRQTPRQPPQTGRR